MMASHSWSRSRQSAAIAGFAFAMLAAAPAAADPVKRWRPIVEQASNRFGVPVAWIERVMRAESGGHTLLAGRPITSKAGAMGLMQLMPSTWSEVRGRLSLGTDPHHPRDNILAGTYYLRLMYDRFGYPGLFAAYNAGPARYAEHLAGRRTLPGETRAYLVTLTGRYSAPFPTRTANRPASPIFFTLSTAAPRSEHRPDGPYNFAARN